MAGSWPSWSILTATDTPRLRLLPLDRDGSSVTDGVAHSPIDLDDSGASPALPALVATRD
ncbi:MAG: hypothetical protein IPF99_29850, partial [Deltaproteobacteria bacterium]|nr:hypothetical protein [Deltaproteobacteria bacterium]